MRAAKQIQASVLQPGLSAASRRRCNSGGVRLGYDLSWRKYLLDDQTEAFGSIRRWRGQASGGVSGRRADLSRSPIRKQHLHF